MSPAPRGGPADAHSAGKARGQPARQEESIYAVQPWGDYAPHAGPVVRSYNVPISSGAASPAALSEGALPGAASRQHDSSQVASLLRSPPAMPPPVPTPTAAKPPNYRRNNAAAVKEMSVLNGLRKAAEAEVRAGPAARWAPSKPAPRPQVPQPRPVSDGSHRDFVRENRVVAPVRQASPAKAADDGSKYLTKPDFGRVPNYLLQRKVQLLEQEEEQLRLREAASIPPGMRQLSEEERLSTLAVLQKNRADLEAAMSALPLRIETPSQVRRRDEIEARMRDVEEGIKAFSRARVLVKE